jgi:hypothetical protein
MRKEIVTRDYTFSDATLKQKADGLLLLLDRDFVEFSDRGFNLIKRADFVAKLDFFDNCPADEQLEGIKMTATEEKNTARELVEKSMRTIFLMARNAFKDKQGKYKEFGNADISQENDEDIVRSAKIVIATATKYLAILADEGLTTAKIAALSDAKNLLDTAIDTQREAINARDIGTEERIEAGNQVYQILVKYSEIGRDIWADTNQSKYKDYVIYEVNEAELKRKKEEAKAAKVAEEATKAAEVAVK